VNAWLLAAGALCCGGLAPCVWLVSRGSPVRRMLGIQVATPVAVLVLVLLGVGLGQSSYLIVPLVLVLAGCAGTLVFTRLLGAGP
jgi:multisubunit Na+/H+ antiporter MnhF subunit